MEAFLGVLRRLREVRGELSSWRHEDDRAALLISLWANIRRGEVDCQEERIPCLVGPLQGQERGLRNR